MIIKGSARGNSANDVRRLARHLMAAENEQVALVELRGVASVTLHEALAEMRVISLATRTRRALYHASINLSADEARDLTGRQWRDAVDTLERHLGLIGHQRAVIRHVKGGRCHHHVVWCRLDPMTLRAAHDGQSYSKHEACARALERRWHLKPVVGAHSRPAGTSRPVARATHKDWQAQTRTGVQVAEVAAVLRRCWQASDDGRSFAAAVAAQGLCLASGRRGIVIVDRAGTPHSLPRRLDIKAAELRRRLADLDPTSLPSVEDAKVNPQPVPRRTVMSRPVFAASQYRRRKGATTAPVLDPNYWQALGYAIETTSDVIIVTLAPELTLEDRGDTMTLYGTPTNEAIAAIVAAAKAKGWQGIHFHGGTPEWQRQARLEALRQGWLLDAISIECEPSTPPVATSIPMPDHIRRRLTPTTPKEAEAPEMPVPAPEAPMAPMYRP
jgi:hypothetical protein